MAGSTGGEWLTVGFTGESESVANEYMGLGLGLGLTLGESESVANEYIGSTEPNRNPIPTP